ncbi:hypothetical protein [Autumnicola psychrophila]|uniref:Uncharacterized protein n=1 Tax=Autumnicola psychrophila TaxID=3075592 RepID=A0ABU3DV98_9FLAO|nr:hypothetical protein [Zunongwangia sp. F225]MDT0687012.1 hypothetical protein [Zunongwangia sp. F225]
MSEANLLLGNSEKAIDLTNKAIVKKQEDAKNSKVLAGKKSDTDSSDTSNGERDVSLTTLTNIIEVAEIQREVRENPSAVKDTTKLKIRIKNTSWNNPGTGAYLSRQISTQSDQ